MKNTAKRRILILSHTHQFSGGGEHSIMQIIKEFSENGHEVHVIVPKNGKFADLASNYGAKTHTIRSY